MFELVLCFAFMAICFKAARLHGNHMYWKGHFKGMEDGDTWGYERGLESGFDVGFDGGRLIGHQEGHECAAHAANVLLVLDENESKDGVQGEDYVQ